jgi:hypothetical protein
MFAAQIGCAKAFELFQVLRRAKDFVLGPALAIFRPVDSLEGGGNMPLAFGLRSTLRQRQRTVNDRDNPSRPLLIDDLPPVHDLDFALLFFLPLCLPVDREARRRLNLEPFRGPAQTREGFLEFVETVDGHGDCSLHRT